MGVHANAKLGPAGRRELVRLIREGSTERQAAACLSVAPATAHRWSVREREASCEQRASGAWALDRSSRPQRCARRTDAETERRVCQARERTGWGPRLLAGETGVAHSTVHAILVRHGLSRRPRPASARSVATSGRAQAICCTWTSSATRVSAARPRGHRRSHQDLPREGAAARSRLLPRRCRRPQPPGLRRAARRRTRYDRHRVRAARAGVVRRPWHHQPAADDRRRLELHPQPRSTRCS